MKRILYLLLTILLITINVKLVYALTINDGDISIGVGGTYNLKISENSGNNLTWTSTDESVATVNSSGLVTGKRLGTSYISVTDGVNIDTCKVTVIDNYVAVTGITLPKDSTALVINESANIGANVTPSNASNKRIRYASSNSSIVRVDSDGNITGVAAGNAYITIVAESKSTIYNVSVISNIKLTGISVKDTYELMEGESGKLTVTYTPSNATNKSVSFKSSNTSIVTVDNSGNMKAIAPGTATITVKSNDGAHVATSKITVNAVDKTLKGISLNKKEITLDPGASETLTVSFNPNNAENKKVTWRSSNSKIVTVEDGKITAKKPGTAEIKAISDAGSFEASCKVTVTSPPVESAKFKNEIETVTLGGTITLEPITTPVDSAILNPIWKSTDETIATVSEYGEVTGIALGETTISVSDKEGKITAEVTVKVVEPIPEKFMITIDGYDLNFDESVLSYDLKIKDEETLNIKTNLPTSKVVIAGNRALQNGSIITVTINNNTQNKKVYVINIHKKVDYSLYFIAIISVILIINIARIIIKNKKNK